ncbi:MAG: ABC transporter permease [Elusimicrobiales bacterium]|nr:ABC transporter permease [Elusimicrobiales bacterium]
MNFNAARALAIALKEVRHILRDPFTLALGLGLPLLLLLMFGFIIDLNYGDIGLKVQDQDHTRLSREFARTFSSSGYFRLEPFSSEIAPVSWLDSEKASGVLVIKENFGRHIKSGRQGEAQLLLDGADNSKTGVVLSYLAGIMDAANRKFAQTPPRNSPEIRTRFLFNQELSSRWFIVPALATVIIGLLGVLLTAMTVAREWENGSMELLLSTPVRPLEIVAGKLLPYFALSLTGTVTVYLAARLVFGVPFNGSRIVYWTACSVFITAALAQGLLISVVARQQRLAMQLSMISGLLPAFLLSGFIFPVESMPVFFRYFTMILSPRWFMEISRGVFLKGAGFMELARPLSALLAINTVLITLAVKKFKTDIEP